MWEIAKNTVKEFLRLKIVYIGIVVWIILIFSSYLLQTLTVNNENRVIIDFSLTMIELFGLLMTLFLGSYLLFNEFSKKTVLLILSRIEKKWHFIVGKFIGFAVIVFLIYLILSVGFILALYFHWLKFEFYYLEAIFLSYIKILIVLAFVMFFSTFVNPFLALIASLFLYLVSHSTSFMLFFSQMDKEKSISPVMQEVIKVTYYVLPNFQDLSMKEYFLSPYLSNYTNFHFMLSTIFGWLFYILILLWLSCLIFERKEF